MIQEANPVCKLLAIFTPNCRHHSQHVQFLSASFYIIRVCRRHQQVSAARTNPCGSCLLLRHLGVADVVRLNTTERQEGDNVHSAGLYINVLCSVDVELYCGASRQLMCVRFSSYRQLSVGSCTTDSSQVLKCSQLTVIRVRCDVTRAVIGAWENHFYQLLASRLVNKTVFVCVCV